MSKFVATDKSILERISKTVRAKVPSATHVSFKRTVDGYRASAMVTPTVSYDVDPETFEGVIARLLSADGVWTDKLAPSPDPEHPKCLTFAAIHQIVTAPPVYAWQLKETTGGSLTIFVYGPGAVSIERNYEDDPNPVFHARPAVSADRALETASRWTDNLVWKGVAASPLVPFEPTGQQAKLFLVHASRSVALAESPAVEQMLRMVDSLIAKAERAAT